MRQKLAHFHLTLLDCSFAEDISRYLKLQKGLGVCSVTQTAASRVLTASAVAPLSVEVVTGGCH